MKISQKEFMMQSEEVDELVNCIEVTPDIADLTFINDREPSPPPQINPERNRVDQKFFIGATSKFDDINLEDDIEKIDIACQESLPENEIVASKTGIDFPFEKTIFKAIPEQNPNESIQSWLQRISDMQIDAPKKLQAPVSISATQAAVSTASTGSNRVVKYQDLPYMGEMTLDNSKPRRGRKPKKADICHLIYKNYGTIFPGTPNPNSYLERDTSNAGKKGANTTLESNKELLNDNTLNKSNVQNRIISSLLEKRLTQENKRNKEEKTSGIVKGKRDQSEPLNLCIRDLNHLKIRFLKNNDNTYSTSEVKSEPYSDPEDDVEVIAQSPLNIKKETASSSASPDLVKIPNPSAPEGFVYWPNAGVFIHPMALQQQLLMYQRLAGNNNNSAHTSHSQRSCTSDKKVEPAESKKITPKQIAKSKLHLDENDSEIKNKRNASTTIEKSPTKRKRSAIFIPPIATENNANPATEVSICKFKFTGGAKPSLQEKKMLSVDSGGNFRYYSGTGDKSMRGYEFFPRETLQQQIHNTQGSSTGAFLQASGEKIYPVPPIECIGGKSSSEFLLTPELPSPTSLGLDTTCITQRHKKRKSRKSLQREKLEQTFKEKGFLIQTQQLESAEGATYCKFRQLRKFTRYLFRSWKDYLPGNVQELQEGERMENEELIEPDNMDSLSINSSEISTNNVQ